MHLLWFYSRYKLLNILTSKVGPRTERVDDYFTEIRNEIYDDEGRGAINCMHYLYHVKPSRQRENMQALYIFGLY